MPIYEYMCTECGMKWEDKFPVEYRDLPETHPCPRCQTYSVKKMVGMFSFIVPEGAYGNAANGYATTHGDAENFKAKSAGKPIPYPKGK